jgi:predicted nicotinamide N-methyase
VTWRAVAAEIGSSLKTSRLRLPRSRCIYEIAQPCNLAAFRTQVIRDQTGPVPYWAMVWPSGIALADAITQTPEFVNGRRVLELGCGLGVTASAALAAGADLIVADCTPEALILCKANARHNTGRAPIAVRCDWRQPEEAVEALGGAQFSVVLAADVAYDPRDVAPLFALLERLVAANGVLWLAEPRRPAARGFLELVHEAGWRGTWEEWHGPWPRSQDDAVIVAVHQLRRVGSEAP